MEIKLSKYTESLLESLKEGLAASDTEVIEEAILHLFRKYSESSGTPEIIESKQPTSLMEVMERSGLL